MRIIFLVLAILLILSPSTVLAATIKINEFYTAGSTTSNPDWVEIYKDGVDISLYQLMDVVNNKKDLAGATCNGNFCTIDWYNYLNNSGDTIKLVLKSAIDSPLDQVIYGSNGDISVPGSGQSAGRNPDITGGWIIASTPTKGGPNNPSTPEPTQTPTPTPTPSPTPTSTSSTTQSSSLFTISNIPSQINSDQSFNVSVNLSLPDNPSTNFYLKGAFKKAGSSNYFGLTKVSGSWIKNGGSFLNQYPITTDSSGNWSGNLEIKPDSDDSGFTGSDDYIFKVGRYTSIGSGPTWSNESTIKIISMNNDQGGTTTNTPSSTTNPSTTPVSSKTKLAASGQPKSYDALANHSASVAGAETSVSASVSSSPKVNVQNQKQINPVIWLGLVFILIGTGSIGYIYLKANGKIHI